MVLGALLTVARAAGEYYAALLYCLATRCNIEAVPLLQHDTPALVHVFSLAKTLALWDAPHYRAPSFAADLRANLANVAIPGTGAAACTFSNMMTCVLAAWIAGSQGRQPRQLARLPTAANQLPPPCTLPFPTASQACP